MDNALGKSSPEQREKLKLEAELFKTLEAVVYYLDHLPEDKLERERQSFNLSTQVVEILSKLEGK